MSVLYPSERACFLWIFDDNASSIVWGLCIFFVDMNMGLRRAVCFCFVEPLLIFGSEDDDI